MKLCQLARTTGRERHRFVEIGGGYGGLALQVLRRMQSVQFVNCDLLEGLYISYYFLRKATDKSIAWALTDAPVSSYEADVVLVPADNDRSITGPIDVVINCNSLSEMAKETLGHYMARLHQWKPSFFLHQNSNFVLFPNSVRHIEVPASEYPLDRSAFEEVYRAMAPWQGAGGRYREFLYRHRHAA
jgi:putative sugar O-methyltransferase